MKSPNGESLAQRVIGRGLEAKRQYREWLAANAVWIGVACFVCLIAMLVCIGVILGKPEPVAPKTAEGLSPQKSGVQVTNPSWGSRFQVLENCQVLLVKTEEESLRPIFDKLADYEILYTFPTTQPVPAEEYILIIRLKPPAKEKQSNGETP